MKLTCSVYRSRPTLALWLVLTLAGIFSAHAQTWGAADLLSDGIDNPNIAASGGTVTFTCTPGFAPIYYDFAGLPSTSTTLSYSQDWTVQVTLTNSIASNSLSSTSASGLPQADAVGLSVGSGSLSGSNVYTGSGFVSVALLQYNNQGNSGSGSSIPIPANSEGPVAAFFAFGSGLTSVATTPGPTALSNQGISYVPLGAATTSGTATLSFSAATGIITATFGGVVIGTYSTTSWTQSSGLQAGILGLSSATEVDPGEVTATNFSAITAPQTGSIQTTLGPAGAVSAGAQWQVDGGTAQGNTATVTGLSVGSHTVTFTTVSGFTTPPSQMVTVAAGVTTAVTGTYTATVVNRTLTLSASPSAGGTVSGGGSFPTGSSKTAIATANSGYVFVNWTNGGSVASTSASYTFTLNANTTLVANFMATSAPTITSSASTTFSPGTLGSFTVTATGFPAPTFTSSTLPSWANLNQTTGVLSGTPPDATGAPFAITLTASNGIGTHATQMFTLNVVANPVSFTTWETTYSVSGSTAVTEHDDTPNLLKYFSDINPTVPLSALDQTALPTGGTDTTTNPGTTYLTITYRQYALATGVTPAFETSSDLVNWTPASLAYSHLVKTETGDSGATDSVMKAAISTGGATKLFVRMTLTLQ